MKTLRIGACSWKFDSWVGLVYTGKNKENYLKEYAAQYNTVEIDQWFWSLFKNYKPKLPDPRVVENYAAAVPDDFKFSVKVPNSITLTHYYQKIKTAPLEENPHFLSNEILEKFLDRLAPLKDHLGPLMFQFEYLNKKKMASPDEFIEKFSAFIKKCPPGYDYALETRNPKYLNRDYFDFINRDGLSHVFVQGYYMPPINEIYYKYADNIQNLTVVRLMGPDRRGIEIKTANKWDKIAAPKDEELTSIITMIEDLHTRDIEVYFNINNHYEGSAPQTIKKIRGFLSQP